MIKRTYIGSIVALLLLLTNCKNEADQNLFEAMPVSKTGLNFVNRILDKKELNIFNYRNFYNGGGVAIGDVNNDGKPDIYVTSNFEKNHLYLNKGDWQFEDITEKAGVAGTKAWSTGVTFADVNGDGLMDIYVCNAGNIEGDKRGNELFINQGIGKDGIPTFIDKAPEAGLLDGGFSTHAAFFDYDRDGDLDMYLLNNSFTPVDKLQYQNFRNLRDPLGGHKLFRNDTPLRDNAVPLSQKDTIGSEVKFTDVSEKAGIYGSLIAFGLGITIGDVNEDNWLDIYISNDFYERDYLYINQRNGTFKEALEENMNHISLSSMGADIADINNDGLLDIFVTDMLPQDDKRLKTTSTYEGYELTDFKLKQGYWHQYMRNMLHLNNGAATQVNNQPSNASFSEVGQLAGVHATDWSWGALIFDMDNDGAKDIFVANGIVKDLTDQDYVAFLADQDNIQAMIEGRMKFDYRQFVDMIPSTPISNFAFRNKGNLEFENKADVWGLGEKGFSNGSAYGDLDNDGDLDLIVNNNNATLGVFRNQSVEKLKTNFLRVNLKGTTQNPNAIGAKVYVYQQGKMQYLQQMPNRGFQSSSDLTLVFGLDHNPIIDSLRVVWQDDKTQLWKNVKANQTLTLNHNTAQQVWKMPALQNNKQVFRDITAVSGVDFLHQENPFIDYNRDGLLKQMYSTQGPALAVGDVNNDGLDDFYIGGGAGMPHAIFAQQTNGAFIEISKQTFGTPAQADETDALFFDADGDKDLDLYVVTGGNEFMQGMPMLHDLFYKNDGKGNFTLSETIPLIAENGSCVTAADFDHDGDQDLFVGTRMISGQYGYTPNSYILQNDGKGNFVEVTKKYLPNAAIGMVTDAVWEDLDKDSFPELIVVGDWAPIQIFKNNKGNLQSNAIPNSDGWWNRIVPVDIDKDGDMDFVAGNLGRNTKLQCSANHPTSLYANDFDHNGSVEQIITCYNPDGNTYPMALKPDLQKVLPVIKKKFIKHSAYAAQPIDAIFSSEQMSGVQQKSVVQPNTCLIINDGKGNFSLQPLPLEAQLSPIYGIVPTDYDHDGKIDLLLTGNFFDILPELGQYDANKGLILKGIGNLQFVALHPSQTGFSVKGQVRNMQKLKSKNNSEIIVLAKNKDKVQLFSW